jgi:hypothetical protein
MTEYVEEIIDSAFSDYEPPCPNPAKHAFVSGWRGGYNEALQTAFPKLYDGGIVMEWYTEYEECEIHMNWDDVIEKMDQDHDRGLEMMEASLKKALSMVQEKTRLENGEKANGICM